MSVDYACSGPIGAPQKSLDLVSGKSPVVVEVGDDFLHERLGKPDGAFLVAEMIVQDRQRELLRILALIGPFKTEFGEALDIVVLVEAPAVDGHHQAIDGPLSRVGSSSITPIPLHA